MSVRDEQRGGQVSPALPIIYSALFGVLNLLILYHCRYRRQIAKHNLSDRVTARP